MTFAFPDALLIAAAVIPVSVILVLWKKRWTDRQLSGVVAPRLREQLTSSINWGRRRVKAVFLVLGLLFMLIAIGRPQWGFQTTEVDRKSIDFFIGLDLSRSMLAEDMDGRSRLDAAKEAISRLIERLGGGERIGLIAFAGEPFVAAPVTEDHEAVRRNLAALEPKMVARPGSDIAAAIRIAERNFANRAYESKALVLVTDGEQLQGDAVIAAREAARNGLRIFTVGVGSANGARIPERQNNGSIRYAKNEFGNEVISRLNQRVLQQIAASGRGSYEILGEEGKGLRAIYVNELVPLGKAKRQKPTQEPGEYFQYPLALAIGFFLAEMLVNERRKSARVTAR